MVDDKYWYEVFDVSYRFVRVSRSTFAESGLIRAIKGGMITRNDDTRIKESAEVELVDSYEFGPDLVRVFADFSWDDGTTWTECLGTFVPAVPSRSVKMGYSLSSLKLYGRLQELYDDAFAKPYTVPAGSNAVEVAKAVVQGMGLEVVAEQSDFVTTQVRYYGIGAETGQGDDSDDSSSDTKLDMVNDLLDLAGFKTAYTDPYGRVVLERYRDPSERAVVWGFEEGPSAKFCAEMEEEYDYTDTANHVVVRYSSDAGDVVVGEAWDNDPQSALSTVSRGRTITKGYAYTELPAVSASQTRQEYADARAKTLLSTAQSVIRRYTFTHAYCPVKVNDVVSLKYPSAGIDETPQIRTQTITLGAGCPVECEARKFRRRS